MSDRAQSVVRPLKVWIPIALLEIEESFEVGPAHVVVMTGELIDQCERDCRAISVDQDDQTRLLFNDVREKTLGLAAVVVELQGEVGHVKDRGLRLATDTIALLRFYSSAAYTPWLTCSCAALGSEFVPSNFVMAAGAGSFYLTQSLAVAKLGNWMLSSAKLVEMRERGLEQIGKLLVEDHLNPFQRDVRVSILAYSKGLTLRDIGDRLVYTLSALEGLLLRDSSEPIQQNLGERMAFLIRKSSQARRDIVHNIRAVYKLRSRYIHHRVNVSEEHELEAFTLNAWQVLHVALSGTNSCPTREAFIDAIDQIKFGDDQS